MAGKFIKTTGMQSEMPNILADSAKSLLNNPYYLFNNASASVCTYYNLNTTMTTLDESTRGNYAELAPESPLRFNKINNFVIYGFNKIEPNLEVGEFGLQASDIQGDAIVLPKTIIPYPGDFFYLEQLGSDYLFTVTAVNPNTLDTGATLYRINYALSSSDGVEHVEPQVVKVFNFMMENYGTNFGCLITSELASDVANIESYISTLKNYYIQLFYDAKIQSFSYLRNRMFKVYDPFLIEFMIRNDTLKGSTNYIYVQQQVYLPNTFGIDYDKTFFSALENKDLTLNYCRIAGNLELCTQKLSLLYAYPQDYYCMKYDNVSAKLHIVNIFDDPAFLDKIRNNTKTNNILKNVIIGYFNDETITSETLDALRHVDYMENAELFYLIPIVIYCMEKSVAAMLS